MGRQQVQVAAQDGEGLAIVTEGPAAGPDVEGADDLQAQVPRLLGDGEGALAHAGRLVGLAELPVHVALEGERAGQPRPVVQGLGERGRLAQDRDAARVLVQRDQRVV